MKHDYIKGILEKIIDSHKILNELKDKPGDLEIIKRELGKIQGLVQVLANKIEKSENNSDTYFELLSASKSYLKEYSFHNEIDRVSQLYSEDPHRIRNMRLSILTALEETKLIVSIIELLETL
ncbi:MAG: hypothetical protein AABZ49_02320 [Thermoproteota archaeon]